MLEKRLRIVGKTSVLEFGEHNVSILNRMWEEGKERNRRRSRSWSDMKGTGLNYGYWKAEVGIFQWAIESVPA